MLFLLISGISGVLLGWKKNSNGVLLADTMTGTTTSMETWLPIYTLTNNTLLYAKDSLHFEPILDRIDVRPEKGVVKYSFKNSLYGLQVDGATSKVLFVEKRFADLMEHIHDGSIIDKNMGWKSGIFKLMYTSILGLGLILFCISGFWLWYGPKLLKR